MTQHLTLLTHNFQEIYHAVHQPKPDPDPLVANFNGTHLYDASRGTGRYWRWIYRNLSFLCCRDLHTINLEKALRHTQKLFFMQLESLQEPINTYQTYLSRAGNGYPIVENDVEQARKTITKWNGGTLPFVKMIQSLPSEHPIAQLMEKKLETNTSPLQGPTPFSTTLASILRTFQRLIDFEGLIGSSIPLEAFKKVFRGKTLRSDDQKDLDTLIKKINTIGAEHVQIVHRSFQSLAAFYAKKAEDFVPQDGKDSKDGEEKLEAKPEATGEAKKEQRLKKAKIEKISSQVVKQEKEVTKQKEAEKPKDTQTVEIEVKSNNAKENEQSDKGEATSLEAFLESRGCTLFQQFDPKHIEWRNGLKKGSVIVSKTNQFVLDNEIAPSNAVKDHTRVFKIVDHPHHVALVAQNRVALNIRQLKQTHALNFGIPAAKFAGIINDGRVALMDRLYPLSAVKWTSKNSKLSKEDLPLVSNLAKMIRSFIKDNFTPTNFNSSGMLFNRSFELRTLKAMQKGKFDFNGLEDFIVECAGKNDTIYRYLMSETGLLKHPTADFYYDSLVEEFKGEESLALDELAASHKIGDPKVVDRSKKLIQNFAKIRRKLFGELLTKHPDYNKVDLNRHLGEALVEGHRQSMAISQVRGLNIQAIMHSTEARLVEVSYDPEATIDEADWLAWIAAE